MPHFKSFIKALSVVGVNILLLEGLSLVSLNFAERRGLKFAPIDVLSEAHKSQISRLLNGNSNYIQFSQPLGWTIKNNGSSNIYQANSQGVRGNKEYSETKPVNITRISSFGDSFTHCDDVRNTETWQYLIEKRDKSLEVMNFGVGGFGLDQAYLRYQQDGKRFHSDIVFIGYMTENINRNVNTFRPFYYRETGLPMAKPRYHVTENKLSLRLNYFNYAHDYKQLLNKDKSKHELSELGKYDYYYPSHYKSNQLLDLSPTIRLGKILWHKMSTKPKLPSKYDPNSDSFKLTTKIFDEFYSDVIRSGGKPIIVVFPNQQDVEEYQLTKQKAYAPLISYFKSKGYSCIDLMGAVSDVKPSKLFNGHYTPKGNQLIASYIYGFVNDRGLIGN